ncbi:MAG: sensor histidine kinase [Chloroflexota bacterium]
MTGRLLRLYLHDRVGLIIALYVNTGLLLGLASLLLAYGAAGATAIRANVAYALLLTTLALVVYLAADLVRWWPFARQMEHLLSRDASLGELVSLPAAGTAEQEELRALAEKVYAGAMAELERARAAHRQQLTFMQLWVHQMKTPVSALSLIAQRGQDGADPEARATMAAVEEEAVKLADGLDLVLTMARLGEFATDYHVRRVDLLSLLRRVINQRKKQFIRLGVFPEIVADGEGDWTVLTDEKWDAFVIDQVVANALKYTSQGGGDDRRLTCGLSRSADGVILSITDRGPGIPPEDLPRVFEPFFTGENGRRFGGATGIGLYLVHQICDRLGQAVALDSRPGTGTVVTIAHRVPDVSVGSAALPDLSET